MPDARWHIHSDLTALVGAVAEQMAQTIAAALAGRGSALLALAGGSTPLPVYQALATRPIDWARVTLFPGDDRLVTADDPLSNVAMLRRAFGATSAQVVALSTPVSEGYHAAGRLADAALTDLPWPPDLVVLGMGRDGHTASLFPGPDYAAALDAPPACRAIGLLPDPLPPEAPVARVTLTRAAIAQAGSVIILITGMEKRAILDRALSEGDASAFPMGRVLARLPRPAIIHWCP